MLRNKRQEKEKRRIATSDIVVGAATVLVMIVGVYKVREHLREEQIMSPQKAATLRHFDKPKTMYEFCENERAGALFYNPQLNRYGDWCIDSDNPMHRLRMEESLPMFRPAKGSESIGIT